VKDGLYLRKGKPRAGEECRDGSRIIRGLRRNGLKVTRQRRILARVFEEMDHVTVDELYDEVSRRDPGVGRITVYRFLKALCGAGMARERHFDDGFSRFDNVVAKEHHDHLICERCGRIVEFSCDRIEALQEEISRSRGFVIHGHRLEIRGLCRDCR
jgi:Fur family ferric uptake transcriptional regulator